LWVLAWLIGASRADAQAGCVELAATLPEALSGCVTEQRLCSSYLRALAAEGGGQEQAARSSGQTQPGELVPLHVQLSTPDQPGDAATTAIELDAFAYGQWLGHRTLSVRARDCVAVPDALALVLALLARQADPALQPMATAPGERKSQPARQAEQDMEPPAAKREQSDSGSFSLGAGAGVFFGALPLTAVALQLQAATLGAPVSLRARATLLWPQEQGVAEGYVKMQDYELALEACAGFSFRDAPRLSLRLCGGPRAGLMVVRARDFALQNDQATEFLLYLGVLPEVSLALGPRTSLQLGVAGAAALIRPRFGVGLGSGARVSALSAPGAIRAELALSLIQIF
jgi:hypothetical protein